MKNFSDSIASEMNATLNDPEFKSIFSTSSVLEKLAFSRAAGEEAPLEVEIEITEELSQEPLSAQATSARGDCVICGKSRPNWSEADGVCKCSTSGCALMGGCKPGCSCGCSAKKAGVSMDDVLVKSAVNALLKASSDLESAGFDRLSAYALVLTNELVAEAKSKKDDKKDSKKLKEKEKAAKEKEKADKEKAKLKSEKDKNAADDKASKEKAKAKAEKLKADKLKAEKDSKKKK
jgi:hypothetical protein